MTALQLVRHQMRWLEAYNPPITVLDGIALIEIKIQKQLSTIPVLQRKIIERRPERDKVAQQPLLKFYEKMEKFFLAVYDSYRLNVPVALQLEQLQVLPSL